MAVSTTIYDQFKIDKLRNYLEDMAQKGHARPFEIFVDNLKIVPKTENAELFGGYESYIDEETQKIRILIYDSQSSPRNNQYVFSMKSSSQALNGPESMDGIIQGKLEALNREHELGRLKEQLDGTMKQLGEAEEYIGELEEQLEKARSNKYKLGNLDLVELGGVVLENLARKNSGLLGKIGLGGIPDDMDDLPEMEDHPSATASFKRKTAEQQQPGENDAREPDYMVYAPILENIEKAFGPEQLPIIMQVLHVLSQEPEKLTEITTLLGIE